MIFIETKGRLGNEMFQYATCRSIAEKYGYKYLVIINPIFNDILKLNLPLGNFENSCNKTIDSDYCINYLQENGKLPDEYLNISDNTRLIGYFQREEFFDFNRNNIQKWFDVTNLIDNDLYNKLYDEYKDYCFIHIRGGDFLKLPYKLPIEYYIKSIEYMKNIDENMKFVIITDDIPYSKLLFPEIECISNKDNLVDFKLLQTSKYLISSNSTFSWWSAYLNDNTEKIIYPFGGLLYGKDTPNFSRSKRFIYL